MEYKFSSENIAHYSQKYSLYNLNSESVVETSTEEHKHILHLQQITTTFTITIIAGKPLTRT